ncbi:PH domain-containing protein [Apiospora rasikravindrae]|uniref:PH domain-containing protein n=1 Tax=Apiospora rasikravindrae TaxID=990691 RepID=A0ABR1S1B0_9PEZI
MAAWSAAGDEPPSSPIPGFAFQNDPFDEPVSPPTRDGTRQRFANFDSQLLALGPNASPDQAKRALEAHLAETDRRMEEAGRLGTALVAQRKELEERLQEVVDQQAEGELSEELKEKLVEIEREYNEVARESARAFLPKQRVPSNEGGAEGSPFVPEGRGGRRSVSPSKFETQAVASPAKLSVPNRKVRNQPAQRVHDIEFAAEISTSLIAQVRNLQSILAQKEEELRDIKIERSRLEYDAEGLHQRVKNLDESESRYKDENWSLETQVHELMAAQKDAAAREKKLQQSINNLQSEKNTAQRELDEVKMNHARLADEYAAAVKTHDVELGAAKRNLVMADSERFALNRKIEDLTGQNQELAKAISSQRSRMSDRQESFGMSEDDLKAASNGDTPDDSPPPSPVKGTPLRHSMLESETLKTSLSHAQRTIQSLRTNVHREKTEKLELRRMLQDARDELEKTRQDPMPEKRRPRKSEANKEFKKPPPRLLGNLRPVRSEIYIDEEDWEDQTDDGTITGNRSFSRQRSSVPPVAESIETDDFETAHETSDNEREFETANDRSGNTTDDFHTGAEDFSSSDDAMTETDSPSKNTLRGRRQPSPLFTHNGHIESTASTDDEYGFDGRRTPTSQFPPLQSKFPVRANRGGFRRSRQGSEDPSFQSPASYTLSSAATTPQQGVQNLAAELGDFDGSDNESNRSATPNRSIYSRPGSIRCRTVSPPPPVPPVPAMPRLLMVNSSMMTEPMQELPANALAAMGDRPVSFVPSEYSEMGTQYLDDSLAKFPSPPTAKDLGLSFEDAENLKQEHARQIEQLHAENATAHATAVDSLKASHADAINRALDEAKSRHAQEVENMKLTHAELANKSAEASAAHAAELEALRADHAARIAQIESELQAQHSSELENLKASHEKELASAKKQSDTAHRAELTALVAAHAAQIELAKKQLSANHEKDLESLKATHAEQIDLSKQGSDEAHAQELEKLKAAHVAQIDEANNNLRATHSQELEALKAAHATQVEQSQKAATSAHAAELASLAAAHSLQLKSAKTESDDSLAKQIELLKATHEEQLQTSKADADAYLARELESLKATHAEQLRSTKADGETTLARELEAIHATHAQQLQSARDESSARLDRELEGLRAAHAKQLEETKQESQTAQAAAIAALAATHEKTLEEVKAKSEASHVADVESLKAAHSKELDDFKLERDSAQAAATAALTASHAKEIESIKADADAEMDNQLESLRKSHSQELDALMESHSKELASLKESHSTDLAALKAEHAAASAQELEGFKAALSKQMESTRSEGDAAHSQQLEAINAAHSEIVEAHKRDSAAAAAALETAKVKHQRQLESVKANHERQLEALRSEHAAAKSKELSSVFSNHEAQLAAATAALLATKGKEIDELRSTHNHQLAKLSEEHNASMAKSQQQASSEHAAQLEALQVELAAVKAKELDALASAHGKQVEALQAEYAAAKAKDFKDMTSTHEKHVQDLRTEFNSAKAKELEQMSKTHEESIKALEAEAAASKLAALEELSASHGIHTKTLGADAEAQKAKELDALSAMHAEQLKSRQAEHEAAMAKLKEEMAASHELKLKAFGSETGASQARELEALRAAHEKDLAALRDEHEASRAKELDELNMRHGGLLESLRTEHKTTLDRALANLKATHDKDIDSLNGTHASTTAAALEALKSNHTKQLDVLKSEHEADLVRHLDSIREEHRSQLEAQKSGSLAEKEELVAGHALELEALRKSLAVARPSLKYSSVSAVSTEPIEQTNEEAESLRSPKRDAFIIPRENEPLTPAGRRNKDKNAVPFIAEDETRQSPSSVMAGPETPESQRPFREMSTNTDARPSRKPMVPTSDSSSQTALTSESIEHLMMKKQHQRTTSSDSVSHSPYVATPGSPIRHHRRTSHDSARGDSGLIAGAEPIPSRRPGSSASAQSSAQAVPPLPANHREAIEAARTGSSSGAGAKGAMGPPLVPASAYKNAGRPWTPRENRPMSPASFASQSQPRLGTPTPRAGRTNSALGNAEFNSPTRHPGRSRQSSLSSFTSEIDTRFNTHGGTMGVDMSDLGTDPRMIQAITQTMIGEYLWKYTRKAGRGEMSENRHRRYFWVHPYTRTLYWSTSDPSAAGKTELRAKSVPIEAVRVVSDDNPMPPGLHRKSLVIISPGRTIKFTCTTGQRHETWFNALSYLLLRTGDEGQADTEEMAGNITQDDVNEFNPSMGQRSTNGTRQRGPASLSSYNSRTTRTESPNVDMMAIPTLTPTHERTSARPGTIGRLSRYGSGLFNSVGRKSRTGVDNAIYEASEVNDSAEELRQIIEQQDRESDRLENVRACCDGKHDVGTLSHSSKRNRHSSANHLAAPAHNHAHPGRSTTPTPSIPNTLRSRA